MNVPVIELSVSVKAEELMEVGEMLTKMGQALAEPAAPVTPAAPKVTIRTPETPVTPAAQVAADTETPASDTGVNIIKGNPLTAPPAPPEVPPFPEVPEPPAAPVALDSSGIPWDARIHAKTKTKKVDGQWKALRGVDKALIASVSAELRAANPDNPADTPQADKNVVFMQLMQKVTGLTTPPAGTTIPKVHINAITAIAVKHGADNIPALLQGPIETINAVAAEVDALCLTLV